MITIQLAPIEEAIASELQDFAENHEYKKNQTQALIAKNDFISASRIMHQCMIWQENQFFVDCFTLEKLDSYLESLMINILSSTTNPRAADLAQQDAWREQYKFCLKVQKMIARRKA